MLDKSKLKEINQYARMAFKYDHFNVIERHEDNFDFFVTRQLPWSKPMGVTLEIFEGYAPFHELKSICLSLPPHTYLCYVQVFEDGSFKTNYIPRDMLIKDAI